MAALGNRSVFDIREGILRLVGGLAVWGQHFPRSQHAPTSRHVECCCRHRCRRYLPSRAARGTPSLPPPPHPATVHAHLLRRVSMLLPRPLVARRCSI
ncbi:hypothetical protein Pcinc_043923 [Petrolisthes cinctipes]|uniref:Uncharacterized protein n=1 Tax=Petrolisthes cinctipes TaxID=88211 RepID=A0AAE1BHU3_PETCI|nr:hypothetical protein Pcinc_043923 [Petrolisthes cinctipes]